MTPLTDKDLEPFLEIIRKNEREREAKKKIEKKEKKYEESEKYQQDRYFAGSNV